MADFLEKSNNYISTIASAVVADDTTIVVSSATNLPDEFDYHLTIWNSALYANPSGDVGMEVVNVTARCGTTLTVTRAQEGRSASAHAVGASIALLLTTAQSDEWEAAINVNETGIATNVTAIGLNTSHRETGGNHPDLTVGNDTDYLDISSGGVISLVGAAKRKLTLRAEVNVDEVKKQAVPLQAQIGAGAFFGYTMPIYAADHEELYFKENVPGRWDGASDVTIHFLVCLEDAEDVGDYFKFQLSWNHSQVDEPVPVATNDETDEIIVVAGRNAQYDAYQLEFTLDWDANGVGHEMLSHDLLSARLRRVDATNPDITNDILVMDWHSEYTVDKMFKAT